MRICAWCGEAVEPTAAVEIAPEPSHGLCLTCLEARLAELSRIVEPAAA
jgi:hypothetical protein